MPVITIDNAGELSKEVKKEIIENCTKAVAEATGKDPKYVYVKINEVKRENFGIGGNQLG